MNCVVCETGVGDIEKHDKSRKHINNKTDSTHRQIIHFLIILGIKSKLQTLTMHDKTLIVKKANQQ